MTEPLLLKVRDELQPLAAALLPIIRQAVRAELQRAGVIQVREPRPGDLRVLRQLLALFEIGQAFAAAEVHELAHAAPDLRRDLRQALQAAEATTPQRVGLLLRRLAACHAAVDGISVVRLEDEAHAGMWELRRAGDGEGSSGT